MTTHEISEPNQLPDIVVLPGDEVVFAPGVYPYVYKPGIDGVTYRAQERWRTQMPFMAVGHDCKVWGFSFHGSDSYGCDGQAGTKIKDCWIQRARRQGITGDSLIVERCLVEFCGVHVQFDHGMYINGPNVVVRNCIVRHCSSYGIHLYHSSGDPVNNAIVTGNLVYGGRRGICLYGNGGIIANNTLDCYGSGLPVTQGENNVVDRNLVHPEDHVVVSRKQGVYWLAEPPVDTGASTYVSLDPWGRPCKGTHIGCYPFDERLTDKKFRKLWYYGWPYQYGRNLPDPFCDGVAGTISSIA